MPLAEKATIIANGISNIKLLFFCMKSFSTAGSNNQAIEDVLAARIKEKNKAKKIL